jgi:hypothetical protein
MHKMTAKFPTEPPVSEVDAAYMFFKVGDQVVTPGGYRGEVVSSCVDEVRPWFETSEVRWMQDGIKTRVIDSPMKLRHVGVLDLLAEI